MTTKSIHSRIRERRMALGLNLRELAARVDPDMAWQTAQKWELEDREGGTVPRRAMQKKLAGALDVSVEWLLTGRDGTLTQDNKYVFVPRYRPRSTPLAQPAIHEVPHRDDADDTLAYRVDFIEKNGLDPKQLAFTYAPDDAMSPRILEDDVLLLDLRERPLQHKGVYLFETPGGLMVRRAFSRMDGMFLLRADAGTYPEEVVPPTLLPAGEVVRVSSSGKP